MESKVIVGVVSLLLLLLVVFVPTPTLAAVNVVAFGAKPDGRTDATKAFLRAWNVVCHSPKSITFYIPKGRYLLRSIMFKGPCRNKINFWNSGTLVARLSYPKNEKTWIEFNRVHGLRIRGGHIDGRGRALWACKRADRSCPFGPPSLTIGVSKNIKIVGLNSIHSKFFHLFIYRSQKVEVLGGTLIAPSLSPNTDGIHVQHSMDVKIIGTNIRSGDDCVSIGPGTRKVLIHGVFCGPGHGISIGSLGHKLNEKGVQDVTIRKVTFRGTDNGLRIKTWGRPSRGYVKKVVFEDSKMINVRYPIIINQNYCPTKKGCPNKHSGVQISDLKIQRIVGTSKTKVAAVFDCSASNPCSGIRMGNVVLTYNRGPTLSSCKNVRGYTFGRNTIRNCF